MIDDVGFVASYLFAEDGCVNTGVHNIWGVQVWSLVVERGSKDPIYFIIPPLLYFGKF